MHKSVVDWLTDEGGGEGRESQRFLISMEDKIGAHLTLARQLWKYDGWKSCGVDDG